MWYICIDEEINKERVVLGPGSKPVDWFQQAVDEHVAPRQPCSVQLRYKHPFLGLMKVDLADAHTCAVKGGDPPFAAVEQHGMQVLFLSLKVTPNPKLASPPLRTGASLASASRLSLESSHTSNTGAPHSKARSRHNAQCK